MSYQALQVMRLPWPTPWPELFGRDAPLLLEIGFGNAEFLLDLAQARPEANVLGVEISLPSLRHGEKKAQQAGFTNLHLVQGDARQVLWLLCGPDTGGGLYLNFPDPWPKAAHHRRRLINDRFLHLAATRLRAGATLNIATDHAGYASAITDCLARTPYFDSRLPAAYTWEDPERLRTKYEQLALAEGRACYYFKWRRNQKPAPDDFPIPQEFPVPHVILRSPLGLAEIGQAFQPIHLVVPAMAEAAEPTQINLVELYQANSSGNLLVEAYVRDEPVTQRLGLLIRQREAGELMIRLHEIGFPRPTLGAKQAVRHLAEWVISLHPRTQVVASNLGLGPPGLEADG